MKILIIAMTDSIHTARWVSQIIDQGWEVEIFPSILGGIVHPELRKVRIHDDFFSYNHRLVLKKGSLLKLIKAIPDMIFSLGNKKRFHLRRLFKVIARFKPEIIHTIEFQRAGYLMLDYLRNSEKAFIWLATNWGSDIFYFAKQDEHKKPIEQILKKCDFYSCECSRDVCLAKKRGLKGRALPVFPNSGGFDLKFAKKNATKRPSARKAIAIKGYQNWAGRALVALEALKQCRDILGGYEIAIYSPDQEVINYSNTLRDEFGLKIKIIPRGTSHSNILKIHAKSRLSIGMSISDAISTSMLEAMVMGSFPIQSNTACADEWIEDGISGFIVEPENVDNLAQKIRKALSDDRLVDRAAKINFAIARKRLEKSLIKKKTISFYKEVARQLKK